VWRSSLLLVLLLSGCSSLEFRNIAKTGITTGVAYAIAGPIPAIANLTTSMAYDELIPDSPQIADIKTKEQAAVHIATEWGMTALYAFIAYMVITLIAVPFIRRWGYNDAKAKYKSVEFIADNNLKDKL